MSDPAKLNPVVSKLRKGDRGNFQTLFDAAKNGDLALLSSVRKADGAKVGLVCALNREGGEIEIVPLAVMVEGNPYELFEAPFVGEE